MQTAYCQTLLLANKHEGQFGCPPARERLHFGGWLAMTPKEGLWCGIGWDPPSPWPSCCQEKGAGGDRFLCSLRLETAVFLSPLQDTGAEEKPGTMLLRQALRCSPREYLHSRRKGMQPWQFPAQQMSLPWGHRQLHAGWVHLAHCRGVRKAGSEGRKQESTCTD